MQIAPPASSGAPAAASAVSAKGRGKIESVLSASWARASNQSNAPHSGASSMPGFMVSLVADRLRV